MKVIEIDFKITKCVHVTQTERKHLKAFLNSGRTSAKVNTKTYVIKLGQPLGKGRYKYEIEILTPYTNDYGEKRQDKQTITLETK